MKTTSSLLFLLLLLYLILVNTPFVAGTAPLLNLTVATDKSTYFQGERVEVSGTLRVGINPIPKWQVALSISFPNGTFLLHATPGTNQTGNFATTFTLPPKAELGNYTVLSSAQWNNQYTIREETFEVKSAEQGEGVQPQIPQKPSRLSPVLLTLIATGVAFCLIIFGLVFYGLVAFQKRVEAPIAPVTPITPVRKADIMRYKKCAKCGRTFLGVYTFCPYCLTFHGKNGYIEKTTV